MHNEDRSEIVNQALASKSGNLVTVGACFAFVKPELFSVPAFSWLSKLVGRDFSKKINIVSLLEHRGIELAGLHIGAKRFARMDLSSISSDKSLYKAGDDFVDLLLVCPVLANSTAMVRVLSNSAPYSQHSVEIGEHGAGKLTLKDLPAGDYEVFFDGCKNKERYCTFTAAQYKLVPLVAALKNRQMRSDSSLDMEVDLSSFGSPVNGPVSIEVFDRNVRQATLRETAQDGLVKLSVPLSGAGPHSLNFQLLDDPTKTATLPIIGSRATERSQTVMNPLGTELFASLMPTEGAVEVRDLYLSEGGLASTPLRLELDDDHKAVLKTATALTSLVVVSIDPTFPSVRGTALDVYQAPHPDNYDEGYRAAVSLFQSGKFEESLIEFKKARGKQANPHPYFSYYVGCCYAKLGRLEKSLQALRQAISDGWREYAHMAGDDDLAALHGHPEFESLKLGGYFEYTFEDLPANHVVEIPERPALNLLALAAVIKDQFWEGWTTFVSPSDISVAIENEAESKSGHSIDIKIRVTGQSATKATAYVIVKDARLLSQERPGARLAAAIKEYVGTESKSLHCFFPQETVASISSSLAAMHASAGASRPWENAPPTQGSQWGASPEPPTMSGWAVDTFAMESSGAGNFQQQSFFDAGEQIQTGSLRGRQAQPPRSPDSVKSMSSYAPSAGAARADAPRPNAANQQPTAISAPTQQHSMVIMKGHEPEVVHADFVPLVEGEATLTVQLPLQETDYIVECFVLAQFQWCAGQGQFRSVTDPLAEFTLPRFVTAGEHASAWLHVGSSSQELTCCLYHNDKELALVAEGEKTFSKTDKINQKLLNLKFAAGPGTYRAVLSDKDGKVVSQIQQTVDEPGKLRRLVRTVHLLKQGEKFDLQSHDSITAVRVLPGLKQSFNLLLDATADYTHACCEQTAAKILSACAMFMFAGDDKKRRDKAASIIIAGIKRQQSMWLPSGGFKSYPERENVLDTHYGPQAAPQHLANLCLLESQTSEMSKDLHDAVEKGLEMSINALRGYGIEFPPKQWHSMHEAYNVCRFSSNGITQKALDYVRVSTADQSKFISGLGVHPSYGRAVNNRIEAAYAAAALMRQRDSVDLGRAITLANFVVKDFNDQGRLYSTADSVAAIALFAEMHHAKIIGGAAKVEINGIVQSINDAINSSDEIHSVHCLEGVVALEVEKIQEEDWNAFNGQLGLRVALEKNGQPQRTFKLGDQVDLRVKLDQGYKDGDLLWLCLPDCFSRIYGGGQVKLFSVDFAGKSETVIPLAVTGRTESTNGKKGQQSLALCVRNMYDEERGANPGLIPLSVSS